MATMSVGELARLIGRSVDTIKRWEKTGLLTAERDGLGRRRFNTAQVERCIALGELALEAQRTSTSLSQLATDREPPMLPLVVKAK
jgi:excisionase family DNA binding protein